MINKGFNNKLYISSIVLLCALTYLLNCFTAADIIATAVTAVLIAMQLWVFNKQIEKIICLK
jgi:hypothetical protein